MGAGSSQKERSKPTVAKGAANLSHLELSLTQLILGMEKFFMGLLELHLG
jgi:hypothetical protein